MVTGDGADALDVIGVNTAAFCFAAAIETVEIRRRVEVIDVVVSDASHDLQRISESESNRVCFLRNE